MGEKKRANNTGKKASKISDVLRHIVNMVEKYGEVLREEHNRANDYRALLDESVFAHLVPYLELDYLSSKNTIVSVPFDKRHTIPGQHLITRLRYKGIHVLWEKGDEAKNIVTAQSSVNVLRKLIEYCQLEEHGTGASELLCLGRIPACYNVADATTDVDVDDACRSQLMDQCIKQFIMDGYLVVPASALASVPRQTHRTIFRESLQLQKLIEGGQRYDSQLLEQVPLLKTILDDPTLVSITNRLLGSDYNVLTHCHMHWSYRNRKDQHWHRDNIQNYNRSPLIQPKLNNVMMMYFPQNTTLELGPTTVRRGSHYSTDHYVPERLDYTGQTKDKYFEIHLPCEAGSVVFMHYDLIHRRMKNTLTERFMFKFMIDRTMQPQDDPMIQSQSFPEYCEVSELDSNYNQELVTPYAEKVWNWLHNKV